MLAIITFVATVFLTTMPNTDTYTVTTETFYGQNMIESKTEMVAAWQYDESMGWFYELPEINVDLDVINQTAASEFNVTGFESAPVLELPAIDVNCTNS